MAVALRSVAHKTWRTLASIQTGVVLLILVVILSAVCMEARVRHVLCATERKATAINPLPVPKLEMQVLRQTGDSA